MEVKSGNNHTMAAIAIFVISMLTAFVLGIIALVAWLSELMDSTSAATLITCGVFAIIAAITYFVAVRSRIRSLTEQLETIYDVSNSIKLYSRHVKYWALRLAALFLRL